MGTKSISELVPRGKRYIVWDVANAGFGARWWAAVMLAKHQRRHEGIAPDHELDPAQAKSKRRQVRNVSPSVDELWKNYQRKRSQQLRPKTLAEYGRIMKTYISPELGATKAVDVRPRDIAS
jgi:hypothetical protein